MPPARVVFGCGSQARYVIDNLASRGPHGLLGLVDLEVGNLGPVHNGVAVRWTLESALAELAPAEVEVIVAHGNNPLKRRVAARLAEAGFRFFSAVHAQAIVSPFAHIAPGCIVNAGAILLPNAVLEPHVIVHSGSVIEHDCVLGEGSNVAPGVHLAGRVQVGKDAYLYTGCAVLPKVRIGAGAVVGAGTVVLKDVPEGARVVGNPARPLT